MLTIDLPWPSRLLHPNARTHWAAKAKATKKARQDAMLMAKSVGASQMDADALVVTATFSAPDKRRRDQDGLMSSIKAYADGISDAIGVDDSKWQWNIRCAPPVKGGNVRLQIEVLG